jgi:TolB protein
LALLSVCAAVLLLVAASGAVTSAAASAVPAGPRLAVVKWTLEPFALQVLTVNPSGSEAQQIAIGSRQGHPVPMPLDAPSWSPDGNLIAFEGVMGKLLSPQSQSEIFIAAPDGSGIRPVPGTRGGRDPIFSPDGRTIAFSRERHSVPSNSARLAMVQASAGYRSTAVWAVDLETGASRRLTPWRNGLSNVPTSFSPDGSVLAIARQGGERASPEVVGLHMDGSGVTVLARDATDGVYSPDGSKMALIRVHRRPLGHPARGATATSFETTTDLFVMKTDGSESRRLTRTVRDFEVWPTWDPSGERLAYARFHSGSELAFLGFGDAIVEINADGSCPKKILSGRLAAFYGPAWQPGASRGAGRIICS